MNYVPSILAIFCLSVVAGTVVPLALASLVQREKIKEIGMILVALSMIGASAGLAGGMSRVGAVGSIIPAFLGMLGGLSIYLFGVDRSNGLIASFGAVALSLSLIFAYTAGSQFRNIGDDHREIRSICAGAYTDHQLLSDEPAFKKFHDRFGTLCEQSMSWHIAS